MFAVLENSHNLFSSRAKQYREKLKSAIPPFIPFIGVWQQDLIELQENSPDIVDGNFVNFSKMQKVADIIFALEEMQNAFYSLLPIDRVQKYLSALPFEPFDDSYAMNLSMALEPPKIAQGAICPWVPESLSY